MQGVLARMVLGVNFGPAVWRVAVVLVFGVWAFVPLGLIMGSAAKDMRSAPAISNLIFFPMVFMSGAAVPLEMLPGWLQGFGRMLPTTYLVQALEGVMVRGEGLSQQGFPLAVMLTSGFIAFGFNSLLFRWESTQPLGAKRIGTALAGLTLLYAIVALVT
tara:strand:- start:495 stop:974 length:480 start_codon:yes stop_codon:yes gene_type:complete